MTIRGVGMFPLCLVVLSTSIAYAQSTVGAVADPAAEAPAAVPAPPPPPSRPADLPPKPPKVTCKGDTLTIAADNSTLDSILAMVRGCTGAKIDVPDGASKVRSFEQLGPGPVRDVLDELLSGTQYNYVIQSSDQNPAKVETVLLTMRTGDVPGGANNSNSISTEIASTPGRRAWAHMQKFDKPDPNSETDVNAQAAAEAAFNGDSNTSAPAAPADANAVQSAASNAAPASSGDADAAAATAANVPPAAPANPASLNPSADPKSEVQDRINSMQQMFDQRRQMIQKQNGTPGQSAGPSN